MRRVSMATRNELVEVIAARYARSDRAEKARILDEFVAVTNFHRKHAMRLLRGGASDRICGKRLKPLVPVLLDAMERHGHLTLEAEVRAGLLAMSAATIDRAPRAVREKTARIDAWLTGRLVAKTRTSTFAALQPAVS